MPIPYTLQTHTEPYKHTQYLNTIPYKHANTSTDNLTMRYANPLHLTNTHSTLQIHTIHLQTHIVPYKHTQYLTNTRNALPQCLINTHNASIDNLTMRYANFGFGAGVGALSQGIRCTQNKKEKKEKKECRTNGT